MSSDTASEHEAALIDAFVVPHKRDRLIGLLGKPKRRQDVIDTLAHFHDLDMRFAQQLSGVEHSPTAILALLSGAAFVGMEMGILVSCIPGRLGYLEGEDGRWILERAPK